MLSVKYLEIDIDKGPSIKNVRRGGVWSNVDRGIKDHADVSKMALFKSVSACFADTSYG